MAVMHVRYSFLHAKDSVLCNTYLWGRQLIVVKRHVVMMTNFMYMYSDGEGRNNMIG